MKEWVTGPTERAMLFQNEQNLTQEVYVALNKQDSLELF